MSTYLIFKYFSGPGVSVCITRLRSKGTTEPGYLLRDVDGIAFKTDFNLNKFSTG